MYKADNLNIRESAILFEFIKFSLLEQFEEYPEVQQKLLESSDTDILSYAIIGKKSPKFVNNELYENMLLDKLKDIIVDNSHLFNESDIEYTVKDFLNEIGSFKNVSANDILQEGLFDNFHVKGQTANEVRKEIADKYRAANTLNKLGYDVKGKSPAQINSIYKQLVRDSERKIAGKSIPKSSPLNTHNIDPHKVSTPASTAHEDITKYSEDPGKFDNIDDKNAGKFDKDYKPDASADNPPSKHDLSKHDILYPNKKDITKYSEDQSKGVQDNKPDASADNPPSKHDLSTHGTPDHKIKFSDHKDITKYSEDQSKGVQDNKPDASADNPPSKHDLSTHGNTANNEVSGNFLTKWAHNIQHSVESNFPKLYHFVQNHGKAIGGAALVGVAGYLAYKAYQNYFSKAAKACSAKSGEQKEICMKQYKQKATQQQISVLQKSISLCKNATNPIKCKTEIQQKIGKLKQKMA